MDKLTRTTPEITDEDIVHALADLDERTEDARTEYAVVYRKDGKLCAMAGFEEPPVALARDLGGVIVERLVVTDFGLWTERTEPAEER